MNKIDFNTFIEAVGFDYEDDKAIRQGNMHRRWAELCDKHDRLVLMTHACSGSTTQLSLYRPLWELSRDPSLKFLIVTNSPSIAQRLSRVIAREYLRIKLDPRLAPCLEGVELPTIGVNLRAGDDQRITVCSAFSSFSGGRFDRIIIDNIEDPETCRKNELYSWLSTMVVCKMSQRAKLVAFGQIHSATDVLHRLSNRPDVFSEKFPVVTEGGAIGWPDQWPLSRVNRLRGELGQEEFARTLLCKLPDSRAAA